MLRGLSYSLPYVHGHIGVHQAKSFASAGGPYGHCVGVRSGRGCGFIFPATLIRTIAITLLVGSPILFFDL